jgi:purine-nucleoside/S-methyl-5'-thioadenosine phosphorylase / adenosine deaminase
MHFFKPFPGILGCFMGMDQSHLKNQGWAIEDLFLLRQVHGDSVTVLKEDPDHKKYHQSEGDGILSIAPEKPIAVKTADCVPILFAHPSGLIGAVHAGWKGSSQEILLKTLKTVERNFQIQVRDLKLAIGPAICPDHYEVGAEVAERFPTVRYPHVIKSFGKKFLLDLRGVNRLQAVAAGVSEKNIQINSVCTFEDIQWHSYRRSLREGNKGSGRNYSWIVRTA